MTERQAHGFVFQKQVEDFYKVKVNSSYTAKWDIELPNENISIKCIGIGNAVELGSLLRFYENTEPFTLIIGWHNNYNIVGSQKVIITKDILQKLKGTISFEEITKAYEMLSIKHFPLTKHEEAREYFKEWKELHKKDLGLLTITGKVDSKTQRRWQCNINKTNWNKLFGKIQLNKEFL